VRQKIFLDIFCGKWYNEVTLNLMEACKMTDKNDLPICPVETTLTLISDKWKVLIIRDLRGGTKRFGELKKSLSGISQKVLTSNLRDMEENGLLTRKTYPEVPPRVEYTLTELGRSMFPILDEMEKWGRKFKENVT